MLAALLQRFIALFSFLLALIVADPAVLRPRWSPSPSRKKVLAEVLARLRASVAANARKEMESIIAEFEKLLGLA